MPAGFTVTTEACVAYMQATAAGPDGLDDQVAERARAAGGARGQARSATRPTRCWSRVRSGARESMPGMLDTVLNLGLNDESVAGLAERTGNERFAWDSYRRFVQMFGNVVMGIEGERSRTRSGASRRDRGVTLDTELDVDALRELVASFTRALRLPRRTRASSCAARSSAVFDSWLGDRAVTYRRINRIPDDWGTAVNVQQMVFGNKGDTSGSGVAFSRDEVTGAPEPSGDFLVNAQGEDVVSGVRNTLDIAEMERAPARLPRGADGDPAHARGALQGHAGHRVHRRGGPPLHAPDAQRQAPGAGRGALRGRRGGGGPADRRREALATIDAEALDALLHPTFDPDADYAVLARGVAASPGAAKGAIVFTAADAVARGEAGEDVVLVRPFTEADDIAGFHAAQGHPHQRGRQGVARRAGRARHGRPGRHRRRRRSRSTSRAAA